MVRRSAAPVAPSIDVRSFEQRHDVLPRAGWPVLACPLTPQTRALIGTQELRLLPPGAHLINVTPHAAGQFDGNAARVADIFVANLERWLQGDELFNAVP